MTHHRSIAITVRVSCARLQELPVSTTHACVGATVAVGLVEGGGGGSINRKVLFSPAPAPRARPPWWMGATIAARTGAA